jgi:hypothetical protein
VLVGVVACRRVVGAFPWLGAIMAMQHCLAMPRCTSWAMSKFSFSSVLLCTPLELVLAILLLSDALGFYPILALVLCVIQAL